MLPGLNALELGRLRLSVGYGTHKKGRPLSPVEVGLLLRQARDAGVALRDCAKAIQLNGTGHIGRFIRILELPQDILHLVDWGHPGDGIAFSCAVEMTSLGSDDDKRAVAQSILAHGLDSKEVRQVSQLRTRSGRPIGECVKEILEMRPTIEKRYVFIGAVTEERLVDALGKLTQRERDAILVSGIERLELSGGSGRLGQRFFTLVGDERFDGAMERVGKDNIETRLLAQIGEAISDAAAHC